MEDHGVDGVDEEAKIGADDYGSRNDEGEDEVIVDPKPAKVRCAVAGGEVAAAAHVPALVGSRDHCQVDSHRTYYDDQWKNIPDAEIFCCS